MGRYIDAVFGLVINVHVTGDIGLGLTVGLKVYFMDWKPEIGQPVQSVLHGVAWAMGDDYNISYSGEFLDTLNSPLVQVAVSEKSEFYALRPQPLPVVVLYDVLRLIPVRPVLFLKIVPLHGVKHIQGGLMEVVQDAIDI